MIGYARRPALGIKEGQLARHFWRECAYLEDKVLAATSWLHPESLDFDRDLRWTYQALRKGETTSAYVSYESAIGSTYWGWSRERRLKNAGLWIEDALAAQVQELVDSKALHRAQGKYERAKQDAARFNLEGKMIREAGKSIVMAYFEQAIEHIAGTRPYRVGRYMDRAIEFARRIPLEADEIKRMNNSVLSVFSYKGVELISGGDLKGAWEIYREAKICLKKGERQTLKSFGKALYDAYLIPLIGTLERAEMNVPNSVQEFFDLMAEMHKVKEIIRDGFIDDLSGLEYLRATFTRKNVSGKTADQTAEMHSLLDTY